MKEPIYDSQMPAGAERYGATSGIEQAGFMPFYITPDVEPAPPSGNKYEGANGACTFINDTQLQCMAPKAKGTEFCIGHLRRFEKEAQKEKESD